MKPPTYIQFLWKSVNAHGVHSPFVYGLVSGLNDRFKVLRNRDYKNVAGIPPQALKTLHETLNYFKSYKLLVLGHDAAMVTQAIQAVGEKANAQIWFYSALAPVPGGLDLGYITGNNQEELLPLLRQAAQEANNNSVVALANIHATPQMETAWETIKKDPAVTVTVDTYHLGLIFFRREQSKQHFIIRTGTSKFTDALLGIRTLWGLLG
jgi:hypothetical protein